MGLNWFKRGKSDCITINLWDHLLIQSKPGDLDYTFLRDEQGQPLPSSYEPIADVIKNYQLPPDLDASIYNELLPYTFLLARECGNDALAAMYAGKLTAYFNDVEKAVHYLQSCEIKMRAENKDIEVERVISAAMMFKQDQSRPRFLAEGQFLKALNNQKIGSIKWLIETCGADINAVFNAKQNTLLNYFAYEGNIDMLEWLVNHGANLTLKSDGGHGVQHAAASSSNLNVLKWVAAKGIDMHEKTADGLSLLHMSISSGKSVYEKIEWLVKQFRLDVNASSNEWPARSVTPLHLAARACDRHTVQYLVELGAELSMKAKDSLGNLPIQYAARTGNWEVVEYLLPKLEDINVLDSFRNSLLHYAVLSATPAIVGELVDLKANVNEVDGQGRTPLHVVICDGQWDKAKLLIVEGFANIYIKDLYGNTPAHYMIGYGQKTEAPDHLKHLLSINAAQKYILDCLLSGYIDDMLELAKDEALTALRACITRTNISPAELKKCQDNHVWEAVEFIQSILHHSCPQNQSTGYAELDNPDMVVYFDENKKAVYEQRGLLSLTVRNDDTTLPITKEAVVRHISNVVYSAIQKVHMRECEKTLVSSSRQTLFSDQIKRDDIVLKQIKAALRENEQKIIPLDELVKVPSGLRLNFIANVVRNRVMDDHASLATEMGGFLILENIKNRFLRGMMYLMRRGVAFIDILQLSKEKQHVLMTDPLPYSLVGIGIKFEKLSSLSIDSINELFSILRMTDNAKAMMMGDRDEKSKVINMINQFIDNKNSSNLDLPIRRSAQY